VELIVAPHQQKAIIKAAFINLVITCTCGHEEPMMLPFLVGQPGVYTAVCPKCQTRHQLARADIDLQKGYASFGVASNSPKVIEVPGGLLQ
jgi:hypothetical protein